MLAVRSVNAVWRRSDSCWIRVRSAAESVAGGSETLDTTLILFVLSWFATLRIYHMQDRWSISGTYEGSNPARSIAFPIP